jgi:hypothetical protein
MLAARLRPHLTRGLVMRAFPLYLLRDLPATRSFLAATWKTLGFSPGQPRMQN